MKGEYERTVKVAVVGCSAAKLAPGGY